jgi:CheY-like chemotaxis protein
LRSSNEIDGPPQLKVLVVDDNVDAATSLAAILARIHGQDVRVAHDGLSALEAASKFGPDVVFLDIGMAGIDGYEVARRLRAQPEFKEILIVALTGWGQASDRRLSEEAGFDRHVVKPIEPEVLRSLLSMAQASAARST